MLTTERDITQDERNHGIEGAKILVLDIAALVEEEGTILSDFRYIEIVWPNNMKSLMRVQV